METDQALEHRLGSVEDRLAVVLRTIKESENRSQFRMLQLENRLLNGVLTTRGKMSPVSSGYHSPEMSINASTPVHDDRPGQNSPYTTSLASKDNFRWTNNPTQGMRYEFSSKCACLYQPATSTPENLVVSAGSTPIQAAGLDQVNWSTGDFASLDGSIPNTSAVFSEFDVSSKPVQKTGLDQVDWHAGDFASIDGSIPNTSAVFSEFDFSSKPDQNAGLDQVDWNTGDFASIDGSIPNTSAVFNELDFSPVLGELAERNTTASSLTRDASGAYRRCGGV